MSCVLWDQPVIINDDLFYYSFELFLKILSGSTVSHK